MVSLIVYGIVAIALASATGYAFLSFTNATRQTTYGQENTIRLEAAVAAVRASLIALNPGSTNTNGILFAPMGVTAIDNQTGRTYTQLPASLASVATAPWGQPYLYCPISLTQNSGLTGVAGTVESPSTGTYAVTTFTDANQTAGLPYVIANSSTNSITNATGYIAFIVSSLGPGQPVPDCSAISISSTTGYISVPNGLVRAVAAGSPYITAQNNYVGAVGAGFPWNQRVFGSTDRMEVYVAAAATGDGTGRDTSNYTTLDAALALWQALQPRQTSLFLSSGGTFPLDSDLDAEDIRSQAQGENTGLLIGTVAGATTLATVTLDNAITLTTPTSFIDVNITANAGSTLTAYKPLIFKNVAYSATVAATAFNVTGAGFSAQNVSFQNTTLTATNATVEFYNWTNIGTATSYVNTQFLGSMAHFSFDAQSAATYTFTGTTSSSPIFLTASAMNVGLGTSVSITNTNDNIYLNNSALSVSGTMTLAGGTVFAGIDAFEGSSVDILTGGAVTVSSSTPYGVFLEGSKLALDGTLTPSNVTAGGIGIAEGEFTGAGTGILAVATTTPCLYLTNAVQGFSTSGTTSITVKNAVPVYISNPASPSPYANYPIFTAVQEGYAPMVGNTTSANVAKINTQAAATILSTNNNDPLGYSYIAGSQYASVVGASTRSTNPSIGAVTANGTTIGYLDPPTLERSVRDLVNLESITGVNLNFYGTCN